MKKILTLITALLFFGSMMTLKADDAFVVGSEAEIFGTAWTAGLIANQMTWNEGLSKYAKVYTVDKAYKSVGLKVVYGNEWYGENGGSENVKFSLSGPGEFVVYFNKATYHVTVAGPIVGEDQSGSDQGFRNTEISERPLKVMIDGMLYILRGEEMHDATGRKMR